VVSGRRSQWTLRRDEREMALDVFALPDDRLSILLPDGRQLSGRVALRAGSEWTVSTSRGVVRVSLTDPLHARLEGEAAPGERGESEEEIRALMPGRVVAVAVAQGDRVEKGSLLLVLEAMKMQNEIRSTVGGFVQRLNVAAGQAVEGGALLLGVRSSED